MTFVQSDMVLFPPGCSPSCRVRRAVDSNFGTVEKERLVYATSGRYSPMPTISTATSCKATLNKLVVTFLSAMLFYIIKK